MPDELRKTTGRRPEWGRMGEAGRIEGGPLAVGVREKKPVSHE